MNITKEEEKKIRKAIDDLLPDDIIEWKQEIQGEWVEFNCDDCIYLDLTEENQQKLKLNRKNHKCMFYNQRIMHGKYHPQLLRLQICLDERTKKKFES